MKNVILTICLVLVLLTSGCGTLMHGPTQEVVVTSNPPGATVTNTRYTCHIKTPGVMKLKRANSTILTARLFGYEEAKQKIQVGLSPWLLGNVAGWDTTLNIIYVPMIPVTTALLAGDMVTGSVGTLSPDAVHFELVPRKKRVRR